MAAGSGAAISPGPDRNKGMSQLPPPSPEVPFQRLERGLRQLPIFLPHCDEQAIEGIVDVPGVVFVEVRANSQPQFVLVPDIGGILGFRILPPAPDSLAELREMTTYVLEDAIESGAHLRVI